MVVLPQEPFASPVPCSPQLQRRSWDMTHLLRRSTICFGYLDTYLAICSTRLP